MNGVRGDRREEAWDNETDEAFLERIDVLVMAEWSRTRRQENLHRLRDDYLIRAEFLSILQEWLATHPATGTSTALPAREELRLRLIAVRQKHLGQESSPPSLTETDLISDGWELPEEEPLDEWSLEGLAPSSHVRISDPGGGCA